MVQKGTKCLSFVVIQKDSEYSDEIVREYDDVEWLQHCLMTEDGVVGCIVSLLALPNIYYKSCMNDDQLTKQIKHL